jgi:sugar phosphate isomerase/epimerase
MKIAFYTSTLGDQPINEIIRWAGISGFDGIEIDVNRHLSGAEQLPAILEEANNNNLAVCSITLFGNLLHPEIEERKQIRERARSAAQDAIDSGVPFLVLFPGGSDTRDESDSYKDIIDFLGELASVKTDGSFCIALENWPGGKRDFIATTPDGWHKLFDQIKSANVGIEFDPSHLLWQGIDPYRAAREFRDRIFLLHGKDTRLFPERVQSVGYGGAWWEYRLPGRGELNWIDFLRFAKEELAFDGFISIEHEDREFAWPEGDLETRKKGFEYGLNILRRAIEAI